MLARLKGTAAACHVLIGTPQGSIGVECSPKGFHVIEEDGNGIVSAAFTRSFHAPRGGPCSREIVEGLAHESVRLSPAMTRKSLLANVVVGSLLSQELAEKTVDLKPWADSEPRLRLLEQLCTQDKKQASHESLRDILSDTSLGAGGDHASQALPQANQAQQCVIRRSR